MSALRVGFIGSGKMATAIAGGIIKNGKILKNGPKDVSASCPEFDAHLLEPFKALGCRTTFCNKTLVDNSDVIILAVKPGIVTRVLDEVRSVVDGNKLVISIAAAVSIMNIQSHLKETAKVVRVMPNTPSLVQHGATVYSLGKHATSKDSATVVSLFSGVGECFSIQEYLIDAATGLSGSGPAYMYLIIESMADAGVKHGLPRDLAYKLAAQTMIGAGNMVLRTGLHPAILKDDVCSPGGATIEAVDILERSGLRTAMMQAVEAATVKCHTMGQASAAGGH